MMIQQRSVASQNTKQIKLHQQKLVSRNVWQRTRGVPTQASFFEEALNNLTTFITNSPINEFKIKLAQAQAGDYDQTEIDGKIDNYVKDNQVMMFSFTTCPFCLSAKQLLDDKGVQYLAIELDQESNGMAIRAELAKRTGRTSMPNIFINGESVGGCNDGPGIKTLDSQGKLDGMLATSTTTQPPQPPTSQDKPAEDDSPKEEASSPSKSGVKEWIAAWKARI